MRDRQGSEGARKCVKAKRALRLIIRLFDAS